MSTILDNICLKKIEMTEEYPSTKIFYWISSADLDGIATLDPRTNRMMNRSFMLRMKKIFDPEICDPLILTLVKESEDDTLYIADGQHRFHCITELMKEGRGKFAVRVDLVKLNTFDELKAYVNTINNRYNFSSEQIDQKRMETIIDDLNSDFGIPKRNNVVGLLAETEGDRKRGVNRPRINKNVFRTELSKTAIYQDRSIGTTAIVIKCGDINKFLLEKPYGLWCYDTFPNPKEKKQNFYEQAERAGCVLGISQKLLWMKLLDEPKANWDKVWYSSFKKNHRDVFKYTLHKEN